MTREQRLKLAELLGLKEDDVFDDFVFQPLGSTTKFHIAISDSVNTQAGNYSSIDCQYDSLPSAVEAVIDDLLLGQAEQMIKQNEDDGQQIKELLEGIKTNNNLGDNND